MANRKPKIIMLSDIFVRRTISSLQEGDFPWIVHDSLAQILYQHGDTLEGSRKERISKREIAIYFSPGYWNSEGRKNVGAPKRHNHLATSNPLPIRNYEVIDQRLCQEPVYRCECKRISSFPFRTWDDYQ
ncbi:hypothetical protein V1478_003160 [Vespula squamosa]|uniref:Ycf15 n=1 Tax=Vespula squamosa TaxID=30214 RepID=A0ABD2BSF2_VESSQ